METATAKPVMAEPMVEPVMVEAVAVEGPRMTRTMVVKAAIVEWRMANAVFGHGVVSAGASRKQDGEPGKASSDHGAP